MPRRKHSYLEKRSPSMSGLASTLAEELKSNKESGQPMIDEREFETGAIRVNVIWDEWENIPHETRTETILRAYEQVEGKEYEKRIALAIGLTVPEAYSSGLLPYQVIPLLRQGDPVSLERCREEMIKEGASLLLDKDNPQLRFGSEEEAMACQKRLIARLPGSEQVWTILKEVFAVDSAAFTEA